MGSSDGANVSSYGELAIDSLIWNDMQFTNIHGPLWSDPTVCYLGQQATAKLAQPPRRITADVFGGTIAADTVLQHAGQPHYNTEISIGGVDLGRFARERLGGPSDLKGTVSGTLSLNGTGRSTYSLGGHGDLHVVDANIYQLPPLVAMLKVLRNRTPNSTAFDRCDMKFDVYGENIHFNQLNLLGDAVSLYGRGQTNFDRRLDLMFYTLVGPADLPIPLWKTVAGHLSEQGCKSRSTAPGTIRSPTARRSRWSTRCSSRFAPRPSKARRRSRRRRRPESLGSVRPGNVSEQAQSLRRRSTMSVGSLGGLIGSAAGVPLSQTGGSETERTSRDAAAQAASDRRRRPLRESRRHRHHGTRPGSVRARRRRPPPLGSTARQEKQDAATDARTPKPRPHRPMRHASRSHGLRRTLVRLPCPAMALAIEFSVSRPWSRRNCTTDYWTTDH